MHATIEQSQSIVRILQYHELKVRRDRAKLLDANNFVKDAAELSYQDKLFHFQRLISLNDYSPKPVFHAFLEFAATDKVSNDDAKRIARHYMESIGFGGQPWLNYRHYDSLNEHLHLVSTKIRPDAKRIAITLGMLKYSRELTHSLEKRFGLEQRTSAELPSTQGRYLQKIRYGQMPLYPTMRTILETIVPQYLYTSLPELNAVLGLFNLKASRGGQGSVVYRTKGMVFYPLSDSGKEEGPYIKASAFPSRPTLPVLEAFFGTNEGLRERHRRRLTSTIDYALAGRTLSLEAFTLSMAREKINVVGGVSTGSGDVWYVDHSTKAVFEGAALGAAYTTGALQQRCLPEEVYRERQAAREQQREGQRMRHSL
jgi:relaxase-like protein